MHVGETLSQCKWWVGNIVYPSRLKAKLFWFDVTAMHSNTVNSPSQGPRREQIQKLRQRPTHAFRNCSMVSCDLLFLGYVLKVENAAVGFLINMLVPAAFRIPLAGSRFSTLR